jgi:AraC family transcriptional regulator, transcriptional activator of pobA
MRRQIATIPTFYLYGEAPKDVEPHFLHLETIKDRSGPVNGRIRPHMHAGLIHIFLFETGSGMIMADEQAHHFEGPHILFVPEAIVHGFQFSPDISGYVLTLSSTYLKALLKGRADLERFGGALEIMPLAGRIRLNSLRAWVLRLRRELVWHAPAQKVAVEANLIGFLVDIYRLWHSGSRTHTAPLGVQARLITRFHELIEASYKQELGLGDYLTHLKVSEAQLRYACEKAGQSAPMQMILGRRIIEAKRLLIYSDLTISECGRSLGFDDPAYFSRLFAKAAGLSPKAYRQAHRNSA